MLHPFRKNLHFLHCVKKKEKSCRRVFGSVFNEAAHLFAYDEERARPPKTDCTKFIYLQRQDSFVYFIILSAFVHCGQTFFFLLFLIPTINFPLIIGTIITRFFKQNLRNNITQMENLNCNY